MQTTSDEVPVSLDPRVFVLHQVLPHIVDGVANIIKTLDVYAVVCLTPDTPEPAHREEFTQQHMEMDVAVFLKLSHPDVLQA